MVLLMKNVIVVVALLLIVACNLIDEGDTVSGISGDGVVAWRAVHHDGQFRTQILDDRPFDHLPGLALSAVYQSHTHALPRRQAVVFQPF